MNEVFKQVAISVVSSLMTAALGQWALTRTQGDAKPSTGQLTSVRLSSVVIGLAVFFFLWHGDLGKSGPVLQSIQARPNFVQKGGTVTVTMFLDSPAPADTAITLTSADPAILAVDGDAIVAQGEKMVTVHLTAKDTPNYVDPIQLTAIYNGSSRRTSVTVGQPSQGANTQPAHPVLMTSLEPRPRYTPASGTAASTQANQLSPPKPQALNPELVSRAEEAQGQLSAEKSYWDNVKSHMPGSSSLRPEITSQLFAAESSGTRCTKAEAANDSSSLSACIDSLNDHLTQLKLQH